MLTIWQKKSGCGVESLTVSDLPVYSNIPFGSYQPEWTDFLKTYMYPSIFGWNFRKVTLPFTFHPEFPKFPVKWYKHPWPTGGLPVVLPARWRHAEWHLPERREAPTSLRDIYKFVACCSRTARQKLELWLFLPISWVFVVASSSCDVLVHFWVAMQRYFKCECGGALSWSLSKSAFHFGFLPSKPCFPLLKMCTIAFTLHRCKPTINLFFLRRSMWPIDQIKDWFQLRTPISLQCRRFLWTRHKIEDGGYNNTNPPW